MNSTQIKRLRVLLNKVEKDAERQDTKLKSQKLGKKELKPLFSSTLFPIQSHFFSPHVDYLHRQLIQLQGIINTAPTTLAQNAIERFEQQISAMINALAAAQTLYKDREYKKRHHPARFKKVVQALTESSHELYLKLNQTKEFERRLEDMLSQHQQQLRQATHQDKDEMTARVLALHQRLGRCRKAISALEYEIERAEKQNR